MVEPRQHSNNSEQPITTNQHGELMKRLTLILVAGLLAGCLASTKALVSQPNVPMPRGTDPVVWGKANQEQRVNMWSTKDRQNKVNGLFIGMRVTPEMRERVQPAVASAMRAGEGTQFQRLQARRSRSAAPGQWEMCGMVNPNVGGKLTGWKPFYYISAPDTAHNGVQIEPLAQRACQGEFVPVGA